MLRRSFASNRFNYNSFIGCHEHIKEYMVMKTTFDELTEKEGHTEIDIMIHDNDIERQDDIPIFTDPIEDVPYIKQTNDIEIQTDVDLEMEDLKSETTELKSKLIELNEKTSKLIQIMKSNQDNMQKLEQICELYDLCQDECLDYFELVN